jgi:pyridoxine kinase
MRVISIQSQVAHGHVGNSAAAFPMRAAGVEVVEIPTTLLSNHPRYPTMRGRVLDAGLVADLLRGVEERGLTEGPVWVLSGYLGSAETAAVVAAFVAKAKAANPGLRYLCDPVSGDDDLGFFAGPDLVRAFRDDLAPLADALAPNRFELGALAGAPVATQAEVAAAARRLAAPVVATTGVFEAAMVSTVVTTPAGAFRIDAPRLDRRPAGTGDLFGGLFAARLAAGHPPERAAALAVSGVHAALRATDPAPWAEMPITSEIRAILDPDPVLAPTPF